MAAVRSSIQLVSLIITLYVVATMGKFGPSVSLPIPGAVPEDVVPISSPDLVLVGLTPASNAYNASLLLVQSTDAGLTVVDELMLPSCFPAFVPINSNLVLLWCPQYIPSCKSVFFALVTVDTSKEGAPRIQLKNEVEVPPDDTHCNYLYFPLPATVVNPKVIWFAGNANNGAFVYKFDIASMTLTTIETNIFDNNTNAFPLYGAADASGLLLLSYSQGPTFAYASIDGETGKAIRTQLSRDYAPLLCVVSEGDSSGFAIGTANGQLPIMNWDWASWKNKGSSITVPGSGYFSGGLVLGLSSDYLFIGAYNNRANNGSSILSQVSVSSKSGDALSVLDQVAVLPSIYSLRVGMNQQQLFMTGPNLLVRYTLL